MKHANDTTYETKFSFEYLFSKNIHISQEYSGPCQIPVDIYLLKFKNGNSRTRCEICSKLTIKTCQWRRSSDFIVNFEITSHLL